MRWAGGYLELRFCRMGKLWFFGPVKNAGPEDDSGFLL